MGNAIPTEDIAAYGSLGPMRAEDLGPDAGERPLHVYGSEDLPQAVSSLAGDVAIRNGVAHAKALTFELPGVVAHLSGDFDLRNQNVKMTGDLRMQADVSHVTTGFKSVLLKPFAPFFRRKQAGAVVPIAISGAPHQYKVSQNVMRYPR